MEMLRFPGTSSSVWAPKIVALMGFSPFHLPTRQRQRLHCPSGWLRRLCCHHLHGRRALLTGGAAGSGMLCRSCRLKLFCISFMSNQLAENRGRGGETLAPFPSKKWCTKHKSLSLLREVSACPCPADLHQLSSLCVARPAEADRTAQPNKGCFVPKHFQAVQ